MYVKCQEVVHNHRPDHVLFLDLASCFAVTDLQPDTDQAFSAKSHFHEYLDPHLVDKDLRLADAKLDLHKDSTSIYSQRLSLLKFDSRYEPIILKIESRLNLVLQPVMPDNY